METIIDKSLDKGLSIHIDYLSFTFPMDMEGEKNLLDAFDNYKEEIADLFWMRLCDYGEITEYSQNGYENRITLGQNITIRFGGHATRMKATIRSEDPTVQDYRTDEKFNSCMVELKGQGCREIEEISEGHVDYNKIFRYFLFERKGRCTRIDIATDDKEGDIIKLSRIVELVSNDSYTSCFRTGVNPPKLNQALGGPEMYDTNGCSIYFGKSNGPHKSDKELCIYDKKAERQFHHDDVYTEYYCRYEMRFRNDLADEVAYWFVKHEGKSLGRFAREHLYKMLRLKHPYIEGKKTKNTLVARWDDLPEWIKFLDNVTGVEFSQRPRMEPTIEIKKEWNSKNITRQKIMFEIADNDVPDKDLGDWLSPQYKAEYQLLLDKLEWFDNHHFTQRDIEEINHYRIRQYGNECVLFSLKDIDKYREELSNRIRKLHDRYTLPF